MNLTSDFCFAGPFTHSLDEKGRFAMPSIFREELGHSERPDLVMALAYDIKYLRLYPYEQWRKLMAEIEEAIPDAGRRNDALRAFSTQVRALNLDKAGRLLLPPELRSAAGLNREIKIIGMGSKIDVWDPAAHEQKESHDKSVMDALIMGQGLRAL